MKYSIFFLGLLGIMYGAKGQKLFSDDRDLFFTEAIAALDMVGTEAADKVAFDFRAAWQGKFTDNQKDQIHGIAKQMQLKGYQLKPYLWWYFSYLAYANSQADLPSDQLSKILEINEQVLPVMSKAEYRNFLLGLNMFMARRILAATKQLQTVTEDGTFAFEVADYTVPNPEDLSEEELVEEPAVVQVYEEPEVQEDFNNDSWDSGGDDWGNSGDDWGNDDWGSGSDDWSSNDSWDNSSDSWGSEEANQSYSEPVPTREIISPVIEDFVAERAGRYRPPVVEGPVIKLVNNNMRIATRYDSLKFKEIDAHFLLKSREIIGSQATINWPQQNFRAKSASVVLNDFYIKADRSDFWTPNARLSFPGLFKGSVEGIFEFKSQRRRKQIGHFPIFTSNKSDIDWELDGKIKFRGGVKIQGNQLFGTSVSREPGRLLILDGKGNSVVLRAELFSFEDSLISSDHASFALRHGEDSLFHSSVAMTYDRGSRQLKLYKNKKHETEPFQSTFFEVNINAESISWDMATDSLNFSIVNGKELVPVTIESNDYFNEIRFKKMGGGFPFHPIVTSIYYANKYGITSFTDQEIVSEFNVDIKQVRGALNMLARYGFADYNPSSGQVQLKEKAFHYYNSAAEKKDFDNILISSIEANKPNATFRLDSGDLVVRGVKKLFFTMDFDVAVEPVGKVVKVKEGRNIEYSGVLNAGDFKYIGKDFAFNYEEFMIDMPKIDSIRIQLHTPDSLRGAGDDGKTNLKNHLTGTSGSLFLDYPDDKAGKIETEHYPYFVSNSESIVYFDGPEILGGAYDKSVFFVVPPFEEDSIDLDSAISFEGYFSSGGIFPQFDETLEIMSDNSLGFVHKIPDEGYNLYGTSARTYEKIFLSNDGIRGGGKIDFLTSTIYSDDFVYYPDSVAAYGTNGFIGPGTLDGASFPEAVLGPYRMLWLPRKDSMYLKNLHEPFKFYNATAELDGIANITTNGVFGSGTMFTRGSKAISKELSFQEFEYSARHAEFEVLSDNPEKPAMAGDDISLKFDLTQNVADISPEKVGVAAISFPYAKIKTSIENAVWDLEDSVVTMTKPDNVPIESSYFYSTLDSLKGLTINATRADYDFNSRELNIQGIPYIKVADALIIPEGNETTILENSVLQPFNNAEIIIDTIHRYHYLYNGNIQIKSSEEFVGTAMYQLVSEGDTFAIKFDSFYLDDVLMDEESTQRMTVSGGDILAKQNLKIAPGFFYKGRVKMYAQRQALELNGAVKLELADPSYNSWVLFDRKPDELDVRLDFDNAYFENEDPVNAGLLYDIRGSIYTSFVQPKQYESDDHFFQAKGTLSFDTTNLVYKIENEAKAAGESYQGHTMIYNDATQDIIFEGAANFFDPLETNVKIQGSVLGSGNRESSEYNVDAFLTIDMKNATTMMDFMSKDVTDIVERLGPPLANDISIEILYKLANLTSDEIAKGYEQSSLKDYKPLFSVSEKLEKNLVISGVKMRWSQAHAAWYNYTKIGISNIGTNDINAKLDGFLELKKDASGNDVFNLFIQAAPGTWYFFSYNANNLLMFSSNSDFNLDVTAKSNFGKARPGEMVLVGGDENETLSFINSFREKYFGDTTPYNLVYPDEISLEDDENFDTIEKDEDDGFGF